jgi:hypothetical protein
MVSTRSSSTKSVDGPLNPTGRVMRAFMLLLGLFFAEHVICAIANWHSTNTYLALAQDPAFASQYNRPLYDVFFVGDRTDVCQPWMQMVYDLALWLLGVHCYINAVSSYMKEQMSFVGEHFCVVMLVHTVFMVAAQVVTILPAGGGLAECIEANGGRTTTDHWPWYGVSFLTQSFADGRACADMIYSGHITNLMILALLGGEYYEGKTKTWHWIVSAILGGSAVVLIVRCQDHYTVDIVLGIGIAWLLCTNPVLKRWSSEWAAFNRTLEGMGAKRE